MQEEFLVYSPSIPSIICSSSLDPNVAVTKACVSPRVNSADPCGIFNISTFASRGLISSIFLPSALYLSNIINSLTIFFSKS